jgi:hypothetical protein
MTPGLRTSANTSAPGLGTPAGRQKRVVRHVGTPNVVLRNWFTLFCSHCDNGTLSDQAVPSLVKGK